MKLFKTLLIGLFSATLLSSCVESKSPTASSTISVLPTVEVYKDLAAVRFSSTYEYATSNQLGYKMKVPYTDTYEVNFQNYISKYTIYDEIGEEICSSEKTFITPELQKDQIIYVVFDVVRSNYIIQTTVTAINHKVVLPYDTQFKTDSKKINVNGKDSLKAAEIKYVKRPGGTYVNCNNPEKISYADLNKALTREIFTGDVFFTFEHNNYNASSYYYGYRVRNITNKDIFITVKNVGFQLNGAGSWLGENEWIQFYNTKFDFDTSNWNETQMKIYNEYYGFSGNYEPSCYQPVTVRLPANQYIYVMGGTTQDAYANFNSFKTANQTVIGGCSNAAVLFSIEGGNAECAFFAYTSPSLIKNDNTSHQGYVITRDNVNYGSQYVGYDTCHGVVDNEAMWTFNDTTVAQKLPVTYKNYYQDNVSRTGTPYAAIKSTEHTKNNYYWVTHINPQTYRDGVGTDMTRYITIDSVTRKKIVIDSDHYDGHGNLANIGNWMMDYQDNFTFINQGDMDRTITLALDDNGSTAVMIYDRDGNVLDKKYTFSRIETFTYSLGGSQYYNHSYLYSIPVPAHSYIQITMEYNLLANSSGYVRHTVYLK